MVAKKSIAITHMYAVSPLYCTIICPYVLPALKRVTSGGGSLNVYVNLCGLMNSLNSSGDTVNLMTISL